MRYILLAVLVSVVYWAAIIQTHQGAEWEGPVVKVLDFRDCAQETVPDLKDNCLMNAALTKFDRSICYKIENPSIASACFRGFLLCDFPYRPHYGKNMCAVDLDKILVFTIQWLAIISALTMVFKWGSFRSWFRFACIFFLAGVGLFLTRYELFYSVAVVIPSVSEVLVVDAQIGGKLVYMSFNGVYMVIVLSMFFILGAIVGGRLTRYFPEA